MSDALHPGRCWFATNLRGVGPCEGPIQKAHLIRAQVIRREVGVEHIWRDGCWVPGCERHHRMLDHSRQIRVPRELLPEAVERLAEEWGLTWWLEREYRAAAA